ncbi:IS5/IS1182 family transposase [Phytohabitans houttuyneae]|uniref:IS5 family transposase n=1 Tax=Phytohabitans houttuyneae TaxID=1076126 RepID=A0A6V8KA37_9ACTN|nr:IS5 family transposase [Phytohabitans houttuyneae]
MLALAHLRNCDTLTRLAVGFGVEVATAWRYVQEAIALLMTAAEDLATAMPRIRRLAYAILDGTLIPIDREPYYSGKYKRHDVNVQVIADAAGRLVWASPALPGSTHDLTAARTHGIIDALTSYDVMTFADKGYQGAKGSVRTPFKRHRHRPKLSSRQKAVNRSHAKIRALGERAIATLKHWKILAKLRCCPRRTTAVVQAILVLHHVENDRTAG